MIDVGSCVVVHLGSPREQIFGMVLALSPAGIVVRGLPVSAVDDWFRELDATSGEGTGLGLSICFYPMHRVEKIALDEPSWGLPSVQDRFIERMGRRVQEHFDGEPKATEAEGASRDSAPSRRAGRAKHR